ncbi:MAG TPA: carboxypeptidase regulatory-like domain-containing protein [Bryobacteraceae bacterium]|nr:carboxypeptidase regulatory-like domain-containing protein [Bryobacteraceae bacterium]
MSMKTLPLTLVCFVLAGTVHAQESRGVITGHVMDSSGAFVAGAQVRATNKETNTVANARTNDAGSYTIPYLVPGTYDLSADFDGFKKLDQTGIQVRVNDVLSIDFKLQVGNATETVEVTGATPLLEASNASIGQVQNERNINDLPVQAGNANELVLLTPGVVNSTNLRQRKSSFNSASSQFTTDGNQLYSNEYTIDGIPDTFFNGGGSPLIAFQLPQNSVSEFKVQTSSFDAAAGHTPGAILNTVSKGGTNEFHGEMHEWMINAALDAATFFQNASGGAKPEYQDNRYGASLGGPVRIPKVYNGKDKTFFFMGWEGNQWGKPTANIGTVPTTAERNGDFSALLALGSQYQIYDPATTVAATNGRFTRQPIPGNLIPASRIDPVAKAIQSFYATPNTVGTAAGLSNYTRNTKDTFDYNVYVARVDHTFSDKNRAFARLSYDKYLETDSAFNNNISGGLDLTRINRGGVVDDVIVVSPNTILDLRYGLTQEETPENRPSKGFNLSSLGFSQNLLSLLDPATQTFPQVYLNTKAPTNRCTGSCTGTFSGFGNYNSGDGTLTGIIHDWAANVTTQHGNHTLRYGADLRLYRTFGFYGGFDVSPQLTFLPTYTNGPNDNSSVAPLGQEYASFLLGIPSGQMTRSASFAGQNTYYAGFIQDDWKITRRLTLNIGLRYEYEAPVSERFDRSVRGFDRTDPNPIAAQAITAYARNPIAQIPVSQFQVLGGLQFAGPGNHNLWSSQTTNLLPRFGLAYQLNDKTVIRTGYGIFYDTIGVNRSAINQTGFTATTPIQASLDNGLHFIATTANPFPNGLLQPQGATAGLATYLGQALTVYPTSRVQPYSQRFTFALQRTVAKDFLVEVGYVGNKAVRLGVDRNLNATPNQYLSTSAFRDQATINALTATVPNPFFGLNSIYPKTIAVADLLRPYPEFGDITETQPIGYSWYHSLQVRSERRFSHGFSVGVGYTFSKAMEATSFLNGGDAAVNRAISNYDRPHRFNLSAIVELPFGRGKAIGNHIPKALDFVIGGWQLNNIFTYQSGAPLSFGNIIFLGDLHSIPLSSSQRSVSEWFNTAAGFDTVSAHQLANNIRTFPKYLAGVRGDGQTDWNLSLFKRFRITERVRMEFRAEGYDIMNHPNFSDPNTTVTSSAFGTVTGQAGLSREFQGALRLTF